MDSFAIRRAGHASLVNVLMSGTRGLTKKTLLTPWRAGSQTHRRSSATVHVKRAYQHAAPSPKRGIHEATAEHDHESGEAPG